MDKAATDTQVRIAAVLGAAEGRDPAVVAVLSNIDPELALFEDARSALAADDPGAALWVFDQGGAQTGAESFAADLAGSGAARASARLLVVLPAGASAPSGQGDSLQYYVASPVSPAAMEALCLQLLAGSRPGGSRAGDQAAGSVRARRPARFEPDRIYEEAKDYVAALLSACRGGKELPLDAGLPIAERLYTKLLHDNTLVVKALEPHQPYDLESHSVNVAIIAGKISIGLALGPASTAQIMHASLAHDVGMAKLPRELLSKAGHYSEAEMEQLHQHPALGAAAVAEAGPKYEWLQVAILQEHERARGQGYPRGLPLSAIDPVAEIIGIADVFEALSHPRTYRSPYTAFDALEQVAGMQDEYFSARVVTALVNEISSFPLDSFVQLSTGEIARVTATNPGNLMRPVVLVQWDSEWTPLDEPQTLDLLDNPSVTVARSLLDAELPIT
ncbi:MAG: HD domain-containing phosphohydrolase [Gemmatimonadota bacterium]